ncbi:hypothetical protein CXB49_14460 [Chromobacterium sp. ATCC 53434]|uniref:GNAT family N-acetyltransferase n=1 Tax=Chromobacterium sp. (strain ATCC 53434 / SC 14030) TaxID=2059672 RepID=UPI000C7640C8|nr:GNAT family N-acetyltransferase [Chromobacterium sp. ATCC 53434]AUH51937.1 hypothetical protein CXB49_14460 [Chromobacterium sp. ATCC 53434]
MSETEFRLARNDDLPAVYLLIQQAFGPLQQRLPTRPTALDETVASLNGHLSNGCQIFLIAQGPRLLACLLVQPATVGCVEVKRLCTHPTWQGRGLGSALLTHVEGQLRRQGVRAIRLATRRRLPDNLRFYQHRGYLEHERRPYPVGIDDELVTLGKTLSGR